MDHIDIVLPLYIAESRELLEEMERLLLNLDQDDTPADSLNAIFRAAHTIKGSAGIFALHDIVQFTHSVESLLDKLREGEIALSQDLTSLLLECRDHIGLLIDRLETKADLPAAAIEHGQQLQLQLQAAEQPATQGLIATPAKDQATRTEKVERDAGVLVQSDNWHISVRFHPDSLRNGMDPLAILRYLASLGTIVNITPLFDALPPANRMDPETCYLGFEINFNSRADKSAIEGVFEFVREDSLVQILPPSSHIDDYLDMIHRLPEEDLQLGEILVQCGSLTRNELDRALNIQSDLKDQSIEQPLGRIVVEHQLTAQPVVESAIEKQAQVRESKSKEMQSVRVDADKLDELINLVGELMIAGAGSTLCAQAHGDGAMIESMSVLTRLVEQVRDAALKMRMVQIGATFNRFQRVVRDVSRELGKEIDLVITGADTELDKTVVEKIGDPLMHLVRNSMDHGIEPADKRLANGKPAKGTLRLNAYHDSGTIVIEVSDDGAGLNHERILAKAIEKGLVPAGATLTIEDIYQLIFEPGFSTAATVTKLSGRGVGMDVVKRNITALRGSVDVQSTFGEGATFRIRLPLTLAIIDGFLVEVEQSSFVVPLDMVLECVELTAPPQNGNSEQSYLDLRGEVLPFIRLRQLFSMGGQPPRRENIVVVNYLGCKVGLAVDKLAGEFQTVIKPLGSIFSHVKGISGSTVLGNGEVALILDVPGLVHKVMASTHADKSARTEATRSLVDARQT